eukprot:1377587-Rhodomonas_salina.1
MVTLARTVLTRIDLTRTSHGGGVRFSDVAAKFPMTEKPANNLAPPLIMRFWTFRVPASKGPGQVDDGGFTFTGAAIMWHYAALLMKLACIPGVRSTLSGADACCHITRKFIMSKPQDGYGLGSTDAYRIVQPHYHSDGKGALL